MIKQIPVTENRDRNFRIGQFCALKEPIKCTFRQYEFGTVLKSALPNNIILRNRHEADPRNLVFFGEAVFVISR